MKKKIFSLLKRFPLKSVKIDSKFPLKSVKMNQIFAHKMCGKFFHLLFSPFSSSKKRKKKGKN